jgi:hypothetical protein
MEMQTSLFKTFDCVWSNIYSNNKDTITRKQAYMIGQRLGIDFSKRIQGVDLINEFHMGLLVELEHGWYGSNPEITNVTNNNLMDTGKIALAHLLEFPDYYTRLKRMEKDGDLYWNGRK